MRDSCGSQHIGLGPRSRRKAGPLQGRACVGYFQLWPYGVRWGVSSLQLPHNPSPSPVHYHLSSLHAPGDPGEGRGESRGLWVPCGPGEEPGQVLSILKSQFPSQYNEGIHTSGGWNEIIYKNTKHSDDMPDTSMHASIFPISESSSR